MPCDTLSMSPMKSDHHETEPEIHTSMQIQVNMQSKLLWPSHVNHCVPSLTCEICDRTHTTIAQHPVVRAGEIPRTDHSFCVPSHMSPWTRSLDHRPPADLAGPGDLAKVCGCREVGRPNFSACQNGIAAP